jgi:quercetin dioxygenase-like cupin family protein
MEPKLVFMLLALALPGLSQMKTQTKPPMEVEITAEPNHHLAFQNAYVRVFQVEVPPHSSTLMHWHRHDYMFVTLGDAEVSNEVLGKSPVTLKLQEAETLFTPGNFAHIARNSTDKPFRNVTIELMRNGQASASQANWDEDRGLRVLRGGTEQILFVKDGVRVSEVELQTAGVLPKHHHAGPQLVVAVSDLLFRNDETGKPASNVEMKSGDVRWEPAGVTHTVTNVGTHQAKLVILEFK